jgi:hypothetical protein
VLTTNGYYFFIFNCRSNSTSKDSESSFLKEIGHGAGDSWTFNAVVGDPLGISDKQGERILVLNNNGAVGIGTTNKLSKLTVIGTADVTNIGGTTSASNTTAITGSGTSFLSNLGIGDRISLSSASSTYATVTAITDDTHLTVDVALGNGTSQTINAKHSTMRVENSSNAVQVVVNDIGSMGIGTNAPSSLLELRKDASAAMGPILTLYNKSSPGGSTAIYMNGYDVGANGPTAAIQSLDSSYSSHITFSTKVPGLASNALQERLRIQNGGNVGIDQTNPGAKLDVNGDVKFSTLGVKLNAGTTNPTTTGVAGNVGDLYVYVNGTSTNLYIKTNTGNTNWSPCKN